jgi:hypothetical protein
LSAPENLGALLPLKKLDPFAMDFPPMFCEQKYMFLSLKSGCLPAFPKTNLKRHDFV